MPLAMQGQVMRALLASVLVVFVLIAPSIARAEEGDLPPQDPHPDPPSLVRGEPPRPTHWYGYETLATDGAALVLAIPALASNTSTVQSGFGVGSAMMYGLGAPIVHFAHGRIGAGFGDLGIRVGMPVVLGFFGAMVGAGTYQQTSCNSATDSFCGLGNGIGEAVAAGEGAIVGGLIGIGGAVAIDAAVIARESVKHDDTDDGQEPSTLRQPSTARIEPTLGVAPERQGGARATVGLVGTF